MRVVSGPIYLMEQLGGLRKATSYVGLWFGSERPSHVVMTLSLTSEPGWARYEETPREQKRGS